MHCTNILWTAAILLYCHVLPMKRNGKLWWSLMLVGKYVLPKVDLPIISSRIVSVVIPDVVEAAAEQIAVLGWVNGIHEWMQVASGVWISRTEYKWTSVLEQHTAICYKSQRSYIHGWDILQTDGFFFPTYVLWQRLCSNRKRIVGKGSSNLDDPSWCQSVPQCPGELMSGHP